MPLDGPLISVVGGLAVAVEVLVIVLALLSIVLRMSSQARSKATPILIVAILGLAVVQVARLVLDFTQSTSLAVVAVVAVLLALITALWPWPTHARPD